MLNDLDLRMVDKVYQNYQEKNLESRNEKQTKENYAETDDDLPADGNEPMKYSSRKPTRDLDKSAEEMNSSQKLVQDEFENQLLRAMNRQTKTHQQKQQARIEHFRKQQSDWEQQLQSLENQYKEDPDIEKLENKPRTFRRRDKPRISKAERRQMQLMEDEDNGP